MKKEVEMCILELISVGYESTKYLINRFGLQGSGILLGVSLTCEELVGVTHKGMILKENCQREALLSGECNSTQIV